MSEEKEPRVEEISPIENPDVSEEKPSKAGVIGCFIGLLLSAGVIALFIAMFGNTFINIVKIVLPARDPAPDERLMGAVAPYNPSNVDDNPSHSHPDLLRGRDSQNGIDSDMWQ